jgi:hypothetical protein
MRTLLLAQVISLVLVEVPLVIPLVGATELYGVFAVAVLAL